jgi:hypothetical protein
VSDAIKLPIEVGQKFLSAGVEVEIVCVTGKTQGYPVIDNYGDIHTLDGLCREDDDYRLQPIPVMITEGVEFSGPEYRKEFEGLAAAGREFGFEGQHGWTTAGDPVFTPYRRYRLLPQHLDANGNPLNVGDRVECEGTRFTISAFHNDDYAMIDGKFGSLIDRCRKLQTVKRPLCADDLDKAPCPQMLRDGIRGYPMWCEKCFWFNGCRRDYDDLEEFQWRPSSGQPWGPCEVTEEVPV